MRERTLGQAAAWLTLMAAPAHAGAIDQLWVGGFAHDVNDISHGVESNSQEILLELDTARPAALRAIGSPRVNMVAALNTAGKTNLFSIGLTWDRRIADRLYGTLDFGLGGSNGLIAPRPGPQGASDERNRLLTGSSVLFREAIGVEWRFTSNWSLGAEFVHASNGEVLGPHHFNRGINDAGLRLGYRFR